MSVVRFSVNLTFDRGGRELIDLLEFSVLSVRTDILFLYCLGEYRRRPQAIGAVAIHDIFCRQHAPARISAEFLLPPKDVRIEHQVSRYRSQPIIDSGKDDQAGSTNRLEIDDTLVPSPPVPPGYLFDSIATQLNSVPNGQVAETESTYDPSLEPYENLADQKLSIGARAFVNNIWLPIVRPQLVSAGFWRLATVA